ncbi:SLC13 family permease [Solirubrobacter phytolaccae]|uniref:SLC13 family permease n=1 Tax=Solirubrobacter phytolaccae TaxID=1404360 RepID=A0A9X3S9L5_9ACTN|nr:SLC13 family permease [Solirubrobacter phytolaccae]MDA0179375.1 SLC13 family permease [Solirubrobacter phytolaccae]
MSQEVVSILVLVAVFAIGTLRPINMGLLGIVAAFVVGTAIGTDEDTIMAGFPGDLFIILVGVTYLFAIANNNGTVDWLVHAAVRAVGGRVAMIPWVMFLVTSILTMVGSVVPAAVAIIAPIALGFAVKYRINPVLMGLMVVNGATAGGFSPISIFGSITNGVVERNNLEGNSTLLWISSFVFNVVLSVVVFFLFGGRDLIQRRVDTDADATDRFKRETTESGQPVIGGGAVDMAMENPGLDRDRILTLIGILTLVGLAVSGVEWDIGFIAVTVAVVLSLLMPHATKDAAAKVAWPTVLLICGIVMYVSLLEEMGTITWVGDQVADVGTPLLAALLICFIGAAVSAFASTTGILGALIPLAVPFLSQGEIGAVGVIIALCIASSVVDSSPFSTSGALVVANTPEERRDRVYKRLLQWGMSMIIIAPITAWSIFVLPGWL